MSRILLEISFLCRASTFPRHPSDPVGTYRPPLLWRAARCRRKSFRSNSSFLLSECLHLLPSLYSSLLGRGMGDSTPAGYRVAAAFIHLLWFTELRKIPLQIHPVGIGHRSVGSLRHHKRLPEGDTPIQEKLEPGPHGMCAGFHDDKAALGNGFQLVGRQQGTLHHLEALAGIVLAPAHRAGEDGAAAQGFGR